MTETKVLLDYKGTFVFETIEALLCKVRESMESLDVAVKTRKRVFNVMVECLENIYKYSDFENNSELPDVLPKVTLAQDGDKFTITSGNTMSSDRVETLKKKIEQVNQMDRNALKERYAEIIDDGHIHDKGGAGLGLIDMALKSRNKLSYQFTPVSDLLTYYELIITINNENTD